MAIPKREDPIKYCVICGELLVRKRFGKRLEDRGVFLRRTRCGQVCGNSKLVVTISALQVRAKKHRKSACEICATTAKLHVHHVDRNPANNDPSNLRTLCASCHLKLHWAEDRGKRMAGMKRRAPQPCVICGQMFHPGSHKTRSCSPPCKAELLSRTHRARRNGGSTGLR